MTKQARQEEEARECVVMVTKEEGLARLQPVPKAVRVIRQPKTVLWVPPLDSQLLSCFQKDSGPTLSSARWTVAG